MKKLFLAGFILLASCVSNAVGSECQSHSAKITIVDVDWQYKYFVDVENRICLVAYGDGLLLTADQCDRLIKRYSCK